MHRYLFRILYDGTHFKGWQKQPYKRTVQGEIEKAMSIVTGTKIEIMGAGRTDTGVHAIGQAAHTDFESEVECNSFIKSVNGLLGKDVRIRSMQKIDSNVHARFDALFRTYAYRFEFVENPLHRYSTLFVPYSINRDNMQAASACFIGNHSFKYFAKGLEKSDPGMCEVYESKIDFFETGGIFHIRANRFLRSMVRSLFSIILMHSRQKITLEQMNNYLIGNTQSRYPGIAPAHPLILTDVVYPGSIYLE